MNTKTVFSQVSKIIRSAYDIKSLKDLDSKHGIKISRSGEQIFLETSDKNDIFVIYDILEDAGFELLSWEPTVDNPDKYEIEVEHVVRVTTAAGLEVENSDALIEAANLVKLYKDAPVTETAVVENRYEFTVLNYNKRADGALLSTVFSDNEDITLAKVKTEMLAANKTGGYQMILEDTTKEKKRERFTKVYCAKAHAEKIITWFNG